MSQEYRRPSAATSRPRGRWLLLVPVLWAAAACAVMRPDAILARAEVPFALKWLVYDESDLAALALRGANDHAGRLPGRLDEPNDGRIEMPATLAAELDAPWPPLADRYYLEYPPVALLLFRLGYVIQGERFDLPPPVADAQQFAVAFFAPRTDAERGLWTRFHVAVQFYIVVMAAALVALMVVLARGYGPDLPGGPVWLLALPGAVFFALNRFDVLPTLATALSFACLGRGRRGWAGAWLAAGVLLKVYPVVFVPVVLRYLGLRGSARWLTGFVGVVAAGCAASVAVLGWDGAVGPFRVQFGREWGEGNWSLYGYVLPTFLARSSTARLTVLTLATLAAVWTRPADLAAVLRRCALVLVVFAVLAVFWSPQWILWFLPLTVPLARDRRVRAATVALDTVNYLSFPVLFWILSQSPLIPDPVFLVLADAMIFVRAAAWAGLAAALFRQERSAGGRDPVAYFRSNVRPLVEQFLKAAAGRGLPRGMEWVSAEPAGEPLVVRDPKTGGLVGLLPVVVQFRPVPGSALEDVPQAKEPRTVTALFAYERGEWRTVGRAAFNLSPAQVAERGRFDGA